MANNNNTKRLAFCIAGSAFGRENGLKEATFNQANACLEYKGAKGTMKYPFGQGSEAAALLSSKDWAVVVFDDTTSIRFNKENGGDFESHTATLVKLLDDSGERLELRSENSLWAD